jgi:PfaB family protein
MVKPMERREPRAGTARSYALAVVGMDIQTGVCPGLAAFEQALYHRKDLFAYPSGVETNGKRPAEVRLRQALQTALSDAGLGQGGAIGIVILSEEVTPADKLLVRRARPLAAILGCSGPVEDIEMDGAAVLEWADQALGDPLLAAVVLGWIDHQRQSAAALVLRRREDVKLVQGRCYAVIDAAAVPGAAEIRESIQRAGAASKEIGYIEFAGKLTGRQTDPIVEAYQQAGVEMTCALGVEKDLPFIPALIKACLCLYQRFLPASPPVIELTGNELLPQTPFYLISESRTWFQPQAAGARRAAVYAGDLHLLLSEDVSMKPRPNQALQSSELRLYPIAGDSLEELLKGLSQLKADLETGEDLRQAALKTFEDYRQRPDARYAAAVMGRGREDTLQELNYALKGVSAAFEKGADWQTPLGSTFAPAPVGHLGKAAFVYPGAFNSYIGMGRDLLRLFPYLHERFGEVSSDLGSVICEELIYPRSREVLSDDGKITLEARLTNDPIAMLKSGTTLSTLYTMILRDIFKLEPGAAFGYSLGENSMMFAMGVWNNGDDASRRLSESDVFRTRLSGPQNAVREHWGLADAGLSSPLWRNYLVMAAPERVHAAMQDESRVYMTHINTPRQVVIGGEPEACQRVIQSLHCAYLQAPFNHALHNKAIQSELEGLIALHDSPVVSVPQARLYSANGYQPLTIERHEIAAKIGQMLCSSLDFPRLVEQVYADGARVFIELGAGSNCAKWIDETLQKRPHASIGINRKGVDDLTSIVRVLAKLCTHRIKGDLSPLYSPVKVSDFDQQLKLTATSAYEV